MTVCCKRAEIVLARVPDPTRLLGLRPAPSTCARSRGALGAVIRAECATARAGSPRQIPAYAVDYQGVTDMAKLPPCGAKTRAGTPCRRPAGWGTDHVGEGRCKLHGGRSLRGFLHPRYKHGRYAQYEVVVTSERSRGERVVVNEVVTEFDAEGRCRGIVILDQREGRELDPPLPLRPQDVEVFRQVPGYTVTVRRCVGS